MLCWPYETIDVLYLAQNYHSLWPPQHVMVTPVCYCCFNTLTQTITTESCVIVHVHLVYTVKHTLVDYIV